MLGGKGGSEHMLEESTKPKNVEDQLYFHGAMPREEVEKLLQQEGQFMVRLTRKMDKEFLIISVCHRGAAMHFRILKTTEQTFYLDGDPEKKFQSVHKLVSHYYRTKEPLTRTGAKLLEAVKRPKILLDDRDLQMDKKLGEGSFGEVWLGRLKDKDGGLRDVAIKKCKERALSDEETQESLSEAKLMFHFQHRNVVAVLGVAAQKLPFRIVMEYCPAGSLDQHLKKMKGTKAISASQKVRYCLEAARGMEYLSSQNCIHRDLAARNCLLGSEGEIKISDFGMSRVKSRGVYKATNSKLPVRWTAPECIMLGRFSEKSDIWSFGVLIWEIFADAEEPWPDVPTNREVYKKVKSGERMEAPRGTPSHIKRLMKTCWLANPQERINFKQAAETLQHVNIQTITQTSDRSQ